MSLESAAAILEAANKAEPTTQMSSANPEAAVPVLKHSEEAVQSKDIAPKTEAKDVESVESKEGEIKEEVKKDEPKEQTSARFALLAKKEKEIYRQSQKLKSQNEEIEKRLSAIESFEGFKSQVKDNPMLALKELGITYDQITQYVLQGKMPNSTELELKQVRDEIAQWKKQQEEEKKNSQEAAKKQAEINVKETISAFQSDISNYIKSNSEKYELISVYEATPLVFSTIDNHFNKTKRLMSIEEGSDIVEKQLEEQAEKIRKAKKFAAKALPQPQAETKQSQIAQQRTLNNDMTSSAPSFLPASSEKERLQRALAALSK